ncbi:MAG: hypothetical protein HKN77_10310 [Woeseiaceae bacterium]|nr:hypothetical protein [Woeseiaceae bacterium]
MTSPKNPSVSWRNLEEFAGIEMAKSYVLSWTFARGTLSIDVDLQLSSAHPFYEKPRPAEKVCIRAAVIDFPYCESIVAGGTGVEESINDTVARLEIGAIEDLCRLDSGAYEISGEFGTVRVDAERPILRVSSR